MKFLTKIIFILMLILYPFTNQITYSAEIGVQKANLKTGWDIWVNEWLKNNSALKNLLNPTTDFTVEKWGQEWISNSLIRIWRDLKNLFFIIAWIYFLILVLRLLFADKSDEEVANFKKWILWISIWVIIIQIAYYFINILFDKNINIELSANFVKIIIEPFISMIQTWASFAFLAMMIYAFYRIVTSNWDEEKAKSWKMTVLYSIIWFIVIKWSNTLVNSVYWKVHCASHVGVNCSNNVDVNWVSKIIVTIINWMNWFIWLITIILIIYAGFLVLTSVWDEEKLKKAKSIILYIAIWLFILVANYIILTFILLNTGK